MTKPITEVFATSIYYLPISNKKGDSSLINKDILDEVETLKRVDDDGKKWSKTNYKGGYTSYGSLDQLHRMSSTFMDLETKIRKHVKKFAKTLEYDLMGGELIMTDCWVNALEKKGTHSAHIHPLSVISGTYYVKTPKNCAPIKFEDPRYGLFMAAPPKKNDAKLKNKQHVSYAPIAGNIVLFESWLRHEVAAHLGDEERVSVSFNYGWVR